ncbi:MAG: glycosyltransferase [bacterium]
MTFFLLGPFYPLRGGIAQYIGVLGKKLAEQGHQVKVLAFKKQFPRFLFPGQTQFETSQDVIHLDSELLFVPWNPFSWYRTFRRIKKGNPDAVIVKYWMPFFAPGFAAVSALTRWFTKVKTIFIIDNVIPHEQRPGDRLLTRFAFRWVDAFIVQSDVVRRDLLDWYPKAKNAIVRQVAHPIYDCYADREITPEEARRQLGLKPAGRLLLFFGLVRQYKGLDTLIQALPRVISELGKDTHLLIAGEFYEKEERYTAQIRALQLQDFITIANQYVPNEQVYLYFRSADLLVLPYRSATQSGVIQVAYHFGLPIVSTMVGGLKEVVAEGETGYLVEPENPAKIADAIIRFYKEDRLLEFKRNAKQAGERFSWQTMISNLVEMASSPR